uniref:cystathionine gamma-lyase n=1 Tax=Ditylenchus dipsaci TaxID=166011 RepID=A0A915EL00_9BILA
MNQISPGHPKVHDYAREGNPTRDVLEENLAALEDGKHCRVFRDHIICSDNIYGGTERYFRRISAGRHGMLLTFVDLNDPEELKAALQPKLK